MTSRAYKRAASSVARATEGSDYVGRRLFSLVHNDPLQEEAIAAENAQAGESRVSRLASLRETERDASRQGLRPGSGEIQSAVEEGHAGEGVAWQMGGSAELSCSMSMEGGEGFLGGRHEQSASLSENVSPLQKERQKADPQLARIFSETFSRGAGAFAYGLQSAAHSTPPLVWREIEDKDIGNKWVQRDAEEIKRNFPCTSLHKFLELKPEPMAFDTGIGGMGGAERGFNSRLNRSMSGFASEGVTGPVRIGLVLSGGPAPGGHNVVAGVYDMIKGLHKDSQLFGYVGGLDGFFDRDFKLVDDAYMRRFRNTGGFDMLWSGRGKVNEEDKPAAKAIVEEAGLHGLVIVGGDGTGSNSGLLAEYFAQENVDCAVVGVPKTIDGDLKSELIECSFGFDTAVKTYSELIGNLCVDVCCGQGVFHFVRVMGRSASHLVLECALQTRPNLVFIGEEVKANCTTLKDIVKETVDLIYDRIKAGKNYGVILVPEGLISFIPQVNQLIKELTALSSEMDEVLHPKSHGTGKEGMGSGKNGEDEIERGAGAGLVFLTEEEQLAEESERRNEWLAGKLTKDSFAVWEYLPKELQQQLVGERENTGYIQVAKISFERLLIMKVEEELKKRDVDDKQWLRMPHYFGYEGRCAIPSVLDANYCYNLGFTAAALCVQRKNGYMAVVKDLARPVSEWRPMGAPFPKLMEMIQIGDKRFPGIIRQLTDIESETFRVFQSVRDDWKMGDYYRSPGPIQFSGEHAGLTNYTVSTPTAEALLAGTDKKDQAMICTRACAGVKRKGAFSPVQRSRLAFDPRIPPLCKNPIARAYEGSQVRPKDPYVRRQILAHYPHISAETKFRIAEVSVSNDNTPKGLPLASGPRSLADGFNRIANDVKTAVTEGLKQGAVGIGGGNGDGLRVGIAILSRQSPGMHNIIWGLHERLKLIGGKCIGLKGPLGLYNREHIEFQDDDFEAFKNMGGVDLLGRSVSHVLLEEAKQREVLETVRSLKLDGLVLVGSSLALTEAANLAEFFMHQKEKARAVRDPKKRESLLRDLQCVVIGVPATASNNVVHELIETNVGFDTASKLYSSLIGNVLTDAASMPKYWHFVRLMGRQPSHDVLECALQTHPNVVIIAEEYGAAQKNLADVVNDIANCVAERAEVDDEHSKPRNFGAVLIPDGLWHHLPNMRNLISELDDIFERARKADQLKEAVAQLLAATDSSSAHASRRTTRQHLQPETLSEALASNQGTNNLGANNLGAFGIQANPGADSSKAPSKPFLSVTPKAADIGVTATNTPAERGGGGINMKPPANVPVSPLVSPYLTPSVSQLGTSDRGSLEGIDWSRHLSAVSRAVWLSLPPFIRKEFLCQDREMRDSYIETEVLLSQMVKRELDSRKSRGEYRGTFQACCHYFGYQGRSAMPSNFDASLGRAHGHLAGICVESRLTGYVTTVRGLCGPVEEWKLSAVPFTCLLTIVPVQQDMQLHPDLIKSRKRLQRDIERKDGLNDKNGHANGKVVRRKDLGEAPVIPNAEVSLQSKALRALKMAISSWRKQDRFCNPGPIQFHGKTADYYTRVLHDEQFDYLEMLRHVQRFANKLKNSCDFGVDESFLKMAFVSLNGLLALREHSDDILNYTMRQTDSAQGSVSSSRHNSHHPTHHSHHSNACAFNPHDVRSGSRSPTHSSS